MGQDIIQTPSPTVQSPTSHWLTVHHLKRHSWELKFGWVTDFYFYLKKQLVKLCSIAPAERKAKNGVGSGTGTKAKRAKVTKGKSWRYGTGELVKSLLQSTCLKI